MNQRASTLLPYLVGIGGATAYGVTMRWLATVEGHGRPQLFVVVSVSMFVVVPIVIGFFAARAHSVLTANKAVFGGWIACALTIVVSMLAGWEGKICVLMATPLMLGLTTVGGLIAWTMRKQPSKAITYSALVVPFVSSPIERQFTPPISLRHVHSEIVIEASPATVWAEIVRVRAISPDDLTPSLASRLGFPRPIEATLDHEGIGGVRHATFEGGVLFVETITDWQVERRLSFDIVANTASIPPTTLDEHVTIGGPYFDVLRGTYTVEPRAQGGVILHLDSELRVSTPFNFYAGPWAEALMSSIQESILRVLVQRCEKHT